jgi:hypothetical protein
MARRDNSATLVAQLPWRHNICLMEKVKEANRRLAYAMAAIKFCSRKMNDFLAFCVLFCNFAPKIGLWVT